MILKILTEKEMKNHKQNVLPLIKRLLSLLEEKIVTIGLKENIFDCKNKTFVTVVGDNIYYSYAGIELLKKIFKIHKIDLKMNNFFVTATKSFSYTFEMTPSK